MMAMILGVSPNSSGTIMRSLLCLPRMEFRLKWLRTSYCRRFSSLPACNYPRLAMTSTSLYVYKLCTGTFPDHIPKLELSRTEIVHVHSETAASTNGYLIMPSLKQPLAIFDRLPRDDSKILYLWLLKKFPVCSKTALMCQLSCPVCHSNTYCHLLKAA